MDEAIYSDYHLCNKLKMAMTLSILTGIPLLFVSFVLGLEWAYISLDVFSFYDLKIVSSFIVLVIYILVLLIRKSMQRL